MGDLYATAQRNAGKFVSKFLQRAQSDDEHATLRKFLIYYIGV